MGLELKAETLDDDTDGNKYGSRYGGIQTALGVHIAIVRFGVEVDESIGYRTR